MPSPARRRLRAPHLLMPLSAACTALTVVLAGPAGPARAAGLDQSAATTQAATTQADSTAALTASQASALARQTGKAVPVPAATTATSTLTANANGTYTLDQSNQPVRLKVGNAWKSLDASLVRQTNGSVAPQAAEGGLTLSGGGAGALASMRYGADSLTLTLPAAITSLPAPVLSGDTATYADVLPGVTLIVTASAEGGFSEVFDVSDAAAAANPALDSLQFGVEAKGLAVSSDAAGNLAAKSADGSVLFSAPAASMWDSAVSAAADSRAVTDPQGVHVDAKTGDPLASTAAGPGAGAHVATLGAHYAGGRLTLTPQASALRGAAAAHPVYPVFIDPSWTFNPPSAPGTEQAHTYVTSVYPTTSYWNTKSLEQVGYTDWTAGYVGTSRSFYRMGLDSSMDGATIISSNLYTPEEWSASCSARPVDLYLTGAISSSTTWDAQPGWTTELGSQNVAHGYDSSCAAATVTWSITGEMQTAANDKWSSITLGLRADNESDDYGWKQFSDTVTLSTTFDKAPNTPTAGDLTTSPTTGCQSSPPDSVGLGSVTLNAVASSPEGTQNPLGVEIRLWKTSVGSGTLVASTDIDTAPVTSGTAKQLPVSEATLNTAAGGKLTEFSWDAEVYDGHLYSSWSPTCNFDYDPTIAGQPVVTTTATSFTVGTSATFSFSPGACPTGSTCSTPTDYRYQLNAAAPQTATASSGVGSAPVIPVRRTNVLTVTAYTSGGNIGESSTYVINAAAAANAAVQDLDGDGVPDLLSVGGTELASQSFANPTSGLTQTGYTSEADGGSGIPAGLWLTPGQHQAGSSTGDGQITTAATDIGAYGNGVAGDEAPSDFTGDEATTGLFYDEGFQDVLAYDPSTGFGYVMASTGDGTSDDKSVLEAEDSGYEQTVEQNALEDPITQDVPLQVTDAYAAMGDGSAYPDLIGVSGDDGNGYMLEYYQAGATPGAYAQSWEIPATATPDGSSWNNWIVTSTDLSGQLALLLWEPSTGALYLWQDVTVVGDSGDGNAVLTVGDSSTLDASGFDTGATLAAIEPAVLNGSGTPDVITETAAGVITVYLVTNLTTTPVLTAQAAKTVRTDAHTWGLADQDTDGAELAAAADTSGTDTLTGNAGVTADTKDPLFVPDAVFNGSSGYLTSSTPVIPATDFSSSGFTISAWVKPYAESTGVVFSQSGTDDSNLMLYPTSTGQWYAGFNSGGTTAATYTSTTTGANRAPLDGWTHVSLTYDHATGYAAIYLNGISSVSFTDASPSTVTGDFIIGAAQKSGAITDEFKGEIADVQTWNEPLDPTQEALQSGTPGYVMWPEDGVSYYDGAQWTTSGPYPRRLTLQPDGNFVLYDGTTALWASGTDAASDAGDRLDLQSDGNLVIYPATGASVWSSGTHTYTDDMMILQPDGNLDIYNLDGHALWSTGTDDKT